MGKKNFGQTSKSLKMLFHGCLRNFVLLLMSLLTASIVKNRQNWKLLYLPKKNSLDQNWKFFHSKFGP